MQTRGITLSSKKIMHFLTKLYFYFKNETFFLLVQFVWCKHTHTTTQKIPKRGGVDLNHLANCTVITTC